MLTEFNTSVQLPSTAASDMMKLKVCRESGILKKSPWSFLSVKWALSFVSLTFRFRNSINGQVPIVVHKTLSQNYPHCGFQIRNQG